MVKRCPPKEGQHKKNFQLLFTILIQIVKNYSNPPLNNLETGLNHSCPSKNLFVQGNVKNSFTSEIKLFFFFFFLFFKMWDPNSGNPLFWLPS